MDPGTVGWVTLALGIIVLLARGLIDPSKPGRPGDFTPEVRRARMMVAGMGVIMVGLAVLLVVHFYRVVGNNNSPIPEKNGRQPEEKSGFGATN